MKPVVFEPRLELDQLLDEYIESKLRAVLKIRPEAVSTHNPISFEEWSQTPEGRVHMSIMHQYVFQAPNITAKSANRIQRLLQSQGQETRGRPALYDPRARDTKVLRVLKVHFLNELIAKGLGVDTSTWALPIEDLGEIRGELPPFDTFGMLERFERWTNFSLPKAAWLLYTREDRVKAAKSAPNCRLDDKGAMDFAEYSVWRTLQPVQLAA